MDVHFILYSGSPRRKELLENLKLGPVSVKIASVEEKHLSSESAQDYVKRNSNLKLEAGKNSYSDFLKEHAKNSVQIAADTVVSMKDLVLEKPQDKNHATDMLQQLSGKVHEVWSGVAFEHYQSESRVNSEVFAVCSRVKFIDLSSQMIDHYLSLNEWQDKAGGYGIQGFAGNFVEQVEGSYSSIVGLPIAQILQRIII